MLTTYLKRAMLLALITSFIWGLWLFSYGNVEEEDIRQNDFYPPQVMQSEKNIETVIDSSKQQLEVGQEQCVQLLQDYDSTKFYHELKLKKLQSYYLSLPSQFKTPKVLAKIAAYAELDTSDLDLPNKDRKFSQDERLKAPLDTKPLSFQASAQVVNWLKKGDTGLLIQAIANHELDANSYIGYQSLLSLVLHYVPKVAASDLISLIESGAKVTLPDLIESSKSRYTSTVRELLLQNATFDVSDMWFDGSRYNSLATVAVSEFNLDALEFWHHFGAPVFSREFHLNSFYYLTAPSNVSQREQGLDIVNYLANEKGAFITAGVKERIVKWYGQSELMSLQLASMGFESAQLEQAAKELKLVIESVDENIATASKLQEQCIDNFTSSEAIATIAQQQLIEKNKYSQIDMLRTTQERQQKLLQSYEKLSQYLNEMEIDRTQSIISATANKQWDKAIEEAQRLSESSDKVDNEMLELLMLQALSGGAPLRVIDELLAKGAELPKDAIHILALNEQLALTKALMSYGLDLNVVDEQGRNALSFCMMAVDGKAMFDFLVNANVAVKPKGRGLDPLDYALKASEFKSTAVDFALTLIELGAPIERSHRQQLMLLELINNKHYQQLLPAFIQ